MNPFRSTWIPVQNLAALIAWASLATDFVLVGAILFRGRPERIRVARALLACAALGLWVGFKCAITMGFATRFLTLHLLYLDTFVLLPVVALVLLTRGRSAVATPVRCACFAALALVPIGIDATFIEPFRLVTERATVEIARERAGVDPIVIAVLGDIQCVEVTDRERDAVARALAAKPDLILIPGDLVQVGSQRLPEILDDFHALLAPLHAPLGVYFVQGDCETKDDAKRLIEGTPARILENEIVELAHGDRRVRLCGVPVTYGSRDSRAAVDRLQSAPGTDDIRIVVSHRPDVIDLLAPNSRIDLVVAAHTHGGQVQIPFFGPPIILSGVPRRVGAGGLHELDGNPIYVSRGIGWEHGHAPRVRFLCAPEVSVLTLVSSGPATPP